MFNAGTRTLLDRLPHFEGLDPDIARRLLTSAYLDIVSIRDLASSDTLGGGNGAEGHRADLRRLASALELHGILVPGIDDEILDACAFVAAEALDVLREATTDGGGDAARLIGYIPAAQFAACEAAALYLIAGYDASAAVASRVITGPGENAEGGEAPALARAMRTISAFFELRRGEAGVPDGPPEDLEVTERVRWELWRRLAESLDVHLSWLTMETAEPESPASSRLATLADRLHQSGRHPDIAHLAALLSTACARTAGRALRMVPGPSGVEFYASYVAKRAPERPLLWPAARHYADEALPGPTAHAVVTVPTGAGKNSVAELAVAQALSEGWVLYLAPTNALVAQILRDLRERFGTIEGVQVRAFLGGAEYTELPGEAITAVEDRQILVMTPEKCSLALRQAPDVFDRMRLCVLDECHLLADPGRRGVVAELVIAEVLHRAPSGRALLLSALVENPEDLAAWLKSAAGTRAVTISEPWRPTRTVRAVLGVDPPGANEAAQPMARQLVEQGRRTLPVEAPVSLLACLQGPWRTASPDDYILVRTGLTIPLTLRRDDDDHVAPDPGGYVNQATSRVAHALAARGRRVLAFLPANKHYSFSVARDMADLEPAPRPSARLTEITALLDLAEAELGVPSLLRSLIERGIAVHTSAMLREEQRASELAFIDGQARVLMATGTLAQGLNLPATAVVIGGTRVGYDPTLPPAIREEHARAQLLNAIGRAGRPYVASRSLAIVIPDRWVPLRPTASPTVARDAAPFLAFEDASIEVRSSVERLVDSALGERVALGLMSEQEQTAFTFIAMARPEDAAEVVRRSFGGFRTGLDAEQAQRVASTLRTAGDGFIDLAGAPPWVGTASHAAGLPLPAVLALERRGAALVQEGAPETIPGWRDLLFTVLGSVGAPALGQTLSQTPWENTSGEAAFDTQATPAEQGDAIRAIRATAAGWMGGEALTEIAGTLLGADKTGDARRGSGNPIPKIISVVENGIVFGLSGAAGALAALATVGSEEDSEGPWAVGSESRAALDLLPVAIRFGVDSFASVAWARWGFRRRRVAHLLGRLLPPPADMEIEEVANWIQARRRELLAGELDLEASDPEIALVRAAVAAERT
jgi:DEAD/DEAH box helicase